MRNYTELVKAGDGITIDKGVISARAGSLILFDGAAFDGYTINEIYNLAKLADMSILYGGFIYRLYQIADDSVRFRRMAASSITTQIRVYEYDIVVYENSVLLETLTSRYPATSGGSNI